MSQDNEIQKLRAEVAEMRAQLASIKENHSSSTETSDESSEVINRRSMFRKAGLVATGVVAGAVLGSTEEAVAADPNDIVKGQVNTTNNRTDLRYTSGTDLTTNIFTVQDSTYSTSTRRAAIGGFADGGAVYNGVYGYTEARNNADVNTGHGLVGYGGSGSRSSLLLVPFGGTPTNDSFSHTRGEQRMTSSGLWICVSSGVPGTWRKVSGFAAAGSFHLLNAPARAYDSRVSQGGSGPLTPTVTEIVDMSAAGVPTGATGVLVNLTIVLPPTGGYAILYSNDAPTPLASSINFEQGKIVGNNVTTRIDSARRAQIFCSSATEYVVDVMGYYQ